MTAIVMLELGVRGRDLTTSDSTNDDTLRRNGSWCVTNLEHADRDALVRDLPRDSPQRRYLRRTGSGLLRVDAAAIKRENHPDGKWLLCICDLTLTPDDLSVAYKQLLGVEHG